MSGARSAYGGLSSVYLPIAVGVFVAVAGLLLLLAVRFRERSGDSRSAAGGHAAPRLEGAYAIALGLVAAFLTVLTFHAEGREEAKVARPAVRIHAIGAQWRWAFAYPGGHRQEGTEEHPATLVVPAGRPVRILLTSQDVIHAFWMPAQRVKWDAIPGRAASFDIEVAHPGFSRNAGECSEFCGLLHAQMRFDVRALPPTAFTRWLARSGG